MAKPAGHKTGVQTSSKHLSSCYFHSRSPALPVAALCVCTLLLSSCAGKKDEQVEHWQNAKPAVMSTLDDIRQEQARMRIQLEKLEERIDRNLQMIAVQRAQIAALSNILDRSRRPKASEDKKTGVQTPVSKTVKDTTQSPEPPADSEAIKDAYTAAYLSLKSLHFDEATKAFRAFLKHYPNSAYSDQAWFWLGESLYNQKKWKEALQAYHIVAADYPHSVKHAAALLKVALLYRHEGKIDEAKALLERLLREHPGTDSAANAKALLLKLEKDLSEKPDS